MMKDLDLLNKLFYKLLVNYLHIIKMYKFNLKKYKNLFNKS